MGPTLYEPPHELAHINDYQSDDDDVDRALEARTHQLQFGNEPVPGGQEAQERYQQNFR
jgi:hypothetical protein